MSTKRGKYGSPTNRKRLAGDLHGAVQPNGLNDPRRFGGSIIGGGGSRAANNVVLDTTDAVILEETTVAVVEGVRSGITTGRIIFMTCDGRVNKTTDQVRVGLLLSTDGAAAIITELLAVAERAGPELLDDVTRRLTALHQGRHVDLHWLRAAIDNVLTDVEDDTFPAS
jgi:hypothetical protein